MRQLWWFIRLNIPEFHNKVFLRSHSLRNGWLSSLNPTKDFRGKCYFKITYLPKKALYKKQSSFPILCWLWENILLFSSIFPNLSVHYCVQFLPIRKMKKYNAGLPSVGFNKSEVLSIRLKPSFTILLETVLLYSLKLPILFSTIEFHNTPYHFTSSPLLS